MNVNEIHKSQCGECSDWVLRALCGAHKVQYLQRFCLFGFCLVILLVAYNNNLEIHFKICSK